MGAKIEFVANGASQDLKLTGTGTINGIDIDLHDVGELTPRLLRWLRWRIHHPRYTGLATCDYMKLID